MKFDRTEPSAANQYQVAHAGLILQSYLQFLQHDLLPRSGNLEQQAKDLYHAPFVVLAHDTSPDPTFFYANRQAQELFGMTWQELVCLPSRLSAEPMARQERQHLLDQVTNHGYIDDYSGVRISKTGKRFLIERATVWNLIENSETVVGQGAAFSSWVPQN